MRKLSLTIAATLILAIAGAATACTSGSDDTAERDPHGAGSWLEHVLPYLTTSQPPSTPARPQSTVTSSGAGSLQTPGPPAPPPTPADATRAKLRAIDLCAMHNPQAAVSIVKGETADSLLPSDDFNDCTLTLHRPDKFTPDYTMAIGVDAVDQDTIQQGQPLQIAGLNFYSRQQSGTDDGHETTPCVVYLPQSDGYTLYLQVEPPVDPMNGAMHVCDVAAAYLKATANSWRTPPTRAEHRTDPALPLAAADPCAATGILTALGGGRVAHAELHQCLYASPRQPTDGTGATAPLKIVNVRYEFDDPNTLTGDDDPTYKQLAIAGMPVAQHDSHSATAGCTTLFRVGDASVTIDEDSSEPPRIQIVEVTAETCALSSQAAAAVIATVR